MTGSALRDVGWAYRRDAETTGATVGHGTTLCVLRVSAVSDSPGRSVDGKKIAQRLASERTRGTAPRDTP
jgi:hypothetical protein